MTEKRAIRRIFGSKRDKGKEAGKELYAEELHNFQFSQNIIRIIKSRRMSMACRTHGTEERGRKARKSRPLRRSDVRTEDNNKMDLREFCLWFCMGAKPGL
jgi:hypothetical protein